MIVRDRRADVLHRGVGPRRYRKMMSWACSASSRNRSSLSRSAASACAALAPVRGLAQLALHGRHEPGQPVLEHEVVGAGLHQRRGGLLADLAGDQDERHVEIRRRGAGPAPPRR